MSIISTLIFKEKNRNEVMQSEYLKELKSLPKGTIKIKKVNGNEYYYLTYRDGEKIVTKYVGKDKDTLFKIKEQLERRKQIEDIKQYCIKKHKAEETYPFGNVPICYKLNGKIFAQVYPYEY